MSWRTLSASCEVVDTGADIRGLCVEKAAVAGRSFCERVDVRKKFERPRRTGARRAAGAKDVEYKRVDFKPVRREQERLPTNIMILFVRSLNETWYNQKALK